MTHPVSFNPYVAALPSYNAGLSLSRAQALTGRTTFARLASNENPDGCSPAVMAVLASSAFEPWRYADPAATALRSALGHVLSVDPAQIVAGNGSEEMISAISRAILVPGAQVVTVVPSFGLHEIDPLASGAEVLKIPMTAAAGFNIDALETAIAAGPRVIFLSTPWNPVGPALDHAALSRLIAAVKPGTLLVLDEAYAEFSDPDIPDGLAMLRDSLVSWVILRTFSKAYGLAGLRVGYAVCADAELARVIGSARTAFNVNGAAQLAAVAALADDDWMRASVKKTKVERLRVVKALTKLGVFIAPSQTNFLFINTDRDSSIVAMALLHEGIIVKAWREPGYEDWLRVTIGSRADNDSLIAAMGKVIG